MLVLGITTSTARIGVALGDDDGVRSTWSAVQRRRHAELLPTAVSSVCDSVGVTLAEIGVVAVDTGPGLFTGLRVGVAAAKGFAFALGVPMVPICSLDLLAFAHRYVSRRITATIDARRSEVFAASYLSVPGGVQRVVEPHTVTPDELAADLQAEPGPHLLVGNGASTYPEVFTHNDRIEIADVTYPPASALVRLAHASAGREEWVDPPAVRCTYLREPDAEINWQTRDGHVGGDTRVRP